MRGEITDEEDAFKGVEGGVIFNLEGQLPNSRRSRNRNVMDLWILPHLFLSCIKEGKIDYIKEIIQYSAKVLNAVDYESQNVFHVLAFSEKDCEILELLKETVTAEKANSLLDSPVTAMVNQLNVYGQSPLDLAILCGRRKYILLKVRYIIALRDLGGQISDYSNAETRLFRYSCLTSAAESGDLGTIMMHYYAGWEDFNKICTFEHKTIAHVVGQFHTGSLPRPQAYNHLPQERDQVRLRRH